MTSMIGQGSMAAPTSNSGGNSSVPPNSSNILNQGNSPSAIQKQHLAAANHHSNASNGHGSYPSKLRGPTNIPGSSGSRLKENQNGSHQQNSNGTSSQLEHKASQQFQQRRIGTGQKIIESGANSKAYNYQQLPASSGERRGPNFKPVNNVRGGMAAGFNRDAQDSGGTSQSVVGIGASGSSHQKSGIPRPTKFNEFSTLNSQGQPAPNNSNSSAGGNQFQKPPISGQAADVGPASRAARLSGNKYLDYQSSNKLKLAGAQSLQRNQLHHMSNAGIPEPQHRDSINRSSDIQVQNSHQPGNSVQRAIAIYDNSGSSAANANRQGAGPAGGAGQSSNIPAGSGSRAVRETHIPKQLQRNLSRGRLDPHERQLANQRSVVAGSIDNHQGYVHHGSSTNLQIQTQANTNEKAHLLVSQVQSTTSQQTNGQQNYLNKAVGQQKVNGIKRLSRKQQDMANATNEVNDDVVSAARYVLKQANSIEQDAHSKKNNVKPNLGAGQMLQIPEDTSASVLQSAGVSPMRHRKAQGTQQQSLLREARKDSATSPIRKRKAQQQIAAAERDQRSGAIQPQPMGKPQAMGLIASQSNKRLPTDSELADDVFDLQKQVQRLGAANLLIEKRQGLAGGSLDRAKVAQNMINSNYLAGVANGQRDALVQSRQELLANEYRKVIENHPGTLINPNLQTSNQYLMNSAGQGGNAGQNSNQARQHQFYDDTDLLSKMFAKEKSHNLQQSCQSLLRQSRNANNASIDNLQNNDSNVGIPSQNNKRAKKRSESVEAAKLKIRLLAKDESKQKLKHNDQVVNNQQQAQPSLNNVSSDESPTHLMVNKQQSINHLSQPQSKPLSKRKTKNLSKQGSSHMVSIGRDDEDLTNLDPNLAEVLHGGTRNQQLLQDDETMKLERLFLINASARYELLSAQQQLIDFHLSRAFKAKKSQQKVVPNSSHAQSSSGGNSNGNNLAQSNEIGSMVSKRVQGGSIANQTIGEVNEQVEQDDLDDDDLAGSGIVETHQSSNTKNQLQLTESDTAHPLPTAGNDSHRAVDANQRTRMRTLDDYDNEYAMRFKSSSQRQRNAADLKDNKATADSSSLGANSAIKSQADLQKRIRQMQFPHQIMQQRLNEMSPLMFGDTIRLPIFYAQQQTK